MARPRIQSPTAFNARSVAIQRMVLKLRQTHDVAGYADKVVDGALLDARCGGEPMAAALARFCSIHELTDTEIAALLFIAARMVYRRQPKNGAD